jgi:hypothetical protein
MMLDVVDGAAKAEDVSNSEWAWARHLHHTEYFP